MFNIALLAKPCFSRHRVQQKLLSHSDFFTTLHSDSNELIKEMNHMRFDGFVLVIEEMIKAHINLFDSLTYHLEDIPMIVVADVVSKPMRSLIIERSYPKLRVIDRNYEINDLPKLLEKMIMGGPIGLRYHCRYRTSQNALIHSERSGSHIARLENISRGGAKIRLNKVPFQDNEIVTCKITSSTGKQHVIQSKIIWKQNTERSCGLVFG